MAVVVILLDMVVNVTLKATAADKNGTNCIRGTMTITIVAGPDDDAHDDEEDDPGGVGR